MNIDRQSHILRKRLERKYLKKVARRNLHRNNVFHSVDFDSRNDSHIYRPSKRLATKL